MQVQSTPFSEGVAPVITPKAPLSFTLFFNKHGHPFDSVKWTRRDAVIRNAKGESVFVQELASVTVTV